MFEKLIFCGYIVLGFTFGINYDNVRNSTGCYGTAKSLLEMDCPSMNVIAVQNLSFVAKINNEPDCKAPISYQNMTYCCDYEADDCEIDVFNTTNEEHNYIPIMEACTGQRTCNERVQWIRSVDHCNRSLYFEYTTYLRAFYKCIEENLIIKNNSNSQSSGEEVYIQTTAYPTATETAETWECSVETICSASIVITAIDVNLTCGEGTIDCKNNNNYEHKKIYQSKGNFLLLNINVNETGKFWIKLSASDSVSSIDVRCGVTRLTTALESCITSTTPVSTPENTEESTMESTSTSPIEITTMEDTSPIESTTTMDTTHSQKTSITTIRDSEDTSLTTDQFSTNPQNLQTVSNIGERVGIALGAISASVAIGVAGYIIYRKKFQKNKVESSFVRGES